MTIRFRAAVATFAATTLLVPALAQAAFEPSESRPSHAAGSDFLAGAVLHARAAGTVTLFAPGESSFRQSAAAQRNPLSASLRSGSDLFLWNLVAIVHSQQIARTFDLVETGLTAFPPSTSVVAPVPLPGAIWLLVMGGLGLAGTRITLRRRQADAQPGRSPVQPAPAYGVP